MPARCLGPAEPGRRLIPSRPPRHLPAAVRARPAARLRCRRPRSHARPPRSGAAAAGSGARAYLRSGAGPARHAPVAPANGRPKASGAAQWTRPAWPAFFREITLREARCAFGSPRLPGRRRGPGGARRAGVAAGIPEGPRGRPAAQLNVRAKTGCQVAEMKTLPGAQGSGGVTGEGRGCGAVVGVRWPGGVGGGGQSRVVRVHRSMLQTRSSPRRDLSTS